ncbi:hypothetical protein TNCV_3925091 [Trichonephila clavipes]|nr:hypothetical protein TNCV_3925091 [Trichonephila clavipes]
MFKITCLGGTTIILKQHLPLFGGAMSTEFAFMDDNAPLRQGAESLTAAKYQPFVKSNWGAPKPDFAGGPKCSPLPTVNLSLLPQLKRPAFSHAENLAQHAWPTSLSPSTTPYMYTGASESIHC